ncbi:DUF2326 domain-containing protein [Gimesia sp.]|uniref:DUF2326 domain-containing protein n=1 Tax=Gimesia sp. TaxID=2024833 RepID=UPI003A944829
MLTEIRCKKFRKEVIEFHPSLNVVLGDDNATNSIGKTTLLMVIDYVFGGETFLSHNLDVRNELGEHEYLFSFFFDGEPYFFKRITDDPDIVFVCTSQYSEIEEISVDEYKQFLKESYGILNEDISFREMVSLFSRIWGKGNLEVKKPLHVAQAMASAKSVENLIKIYNKYGKIKEITTALKNANEKKTALSKASKTKLIPKITKTKYKQNIKKVEHIEQEIKEIGEDLKKYATNINEIVNREILEFKVEKDRLLEVKLETQAKLENVRNNLADNRHIKSRHLRSLTEYFPDVDMTKLENVELFHDEISKILKKELVRNEEDFSAQLKLVNDEINTIDSHINKTLSSVDNPTLIIDRVYSLARELMDVQIENGFYETGEEFKVETKDYQISLDLTLTEILDDMEGLINSQIEKLISSVYGGGRKSPVLNLYPKKYSYEVFEDTGTGKAYSDLLIFDLAVFSTAEVPFLIHDSILFKNIETNAVAGLISSYLNFQKQSFIAIDEIKKYGPDTEELLLDHKVIQLSGEQVLYIKDWRSA